MGEERSQYFASYWPFTVSHYHSLRDSVSGFSREDLNLLLNVSYRFCLHRSCLYISRECPSFYHIISKIYWYDDLLINLLSYDMRVKQSLRAFLLVSGENRSYHTFRVMIGMKTAKASSVLVEYLYMVNLWEKIILKSKKYCYPDKNYLLVFNSSMVSLIERSYYDSSIFFSSIFFSAKIWENQSWSVLIAFLINMCTSSWTAL